MNWNILGSFVLIFLLSNCCNQKETCICKDPEICIEGDCKLPENTYRYGGGYIISSNLYRGINLDCFCGDTLFLDVRDGRFTVIGRGGGSFGAPVVERISETELVLVTSNRLCFQNGGYHARIHAVLHSDHIDTKLYFFNSNTPDQIRDSCEMTLFKL